MRVALIGPEIEENLGLRYIHASLVAAGHEARIFDFQEAGQAEMLAHEVMAWGADVVGLSLVFTGRAKEFLALAERIRADGFEGHITAGGHFATFHASELLERFRFMDSIVHGEGEESIVSLVESLGDLSRVEGLSYRGEAGEVVRTASRRHPDDLDLKAWPTRPEKLRRWMGMPVASMLGSRGCYGRCTYCSIQAWFRENPGKRLRQRAVEAIADEMASLYHDRGVRIFGFHDDNFFVPSKSRNVKRFLSLEMCLAERGVGRIGLQIKARPDSVDAETFALLRRMGLFRVFLGVESNAQAGLDTLGRCVDRKVNHTALGILDELGVQSSFNLLMFDPETSLEDLRENIEFMRKWSYMPMNFGRVEVYSGTPIEKSMREQGRLRGDIFGYHYRIRNDRAQSAFEMYARVFLPRNFEPDGLASVSMKVDYLQHILAHFHPDRTDVALVHEVSDTIAELNENSAELLEQICDFLSADPMPGGEEIESVSLKLSRARKQFDARHGPRFAKLIDEIEKRAAQKPGARTGLIARAATAAAVVAVVGTAGCKQPTVDQEKPPTPHGLEVDEPEENVVVEEPPPVEEPPAPVVDASTVDVLGDTSEIVTPPAPPVKKIEKTKKKIRKKPRPSKGLPPDYNEMMMYPMGLDDD